MLFDNIRTAKTESQLESRVERLMSQYNEKLGKETYLEAADRVAERNQTLSAGLVLAHEKGLELSAEKGLDYGY